MKRGSGLVPALVLSLLSGVSDAQQVGGYHRVVEDYGAQCGGPPEVNNQAFQSWATAFRASGGIAVGYPCKFSLTQPIDLRSNTSGNAERYRFEIDGRGMILDFAGTTQTNAVMVRLGATAQDKFHEHGRYRARDFDVWLPDLGPIGSSDSLSPPNHHLIGIEFEYAYRLQLSNIMVTNAYRAYSGIFSFPASTDNLGAHRFITGLLLQGDMTLGSHRAMSLKNGRFGLVMRGGTWSGKNYGQHFVALNLEGNIVGGVLEPGENGYVGGLTFEHYHNEAHLLDAWRIGLSWNESDAGDTGQPRPNARTERLIFSNGTMSEGWQLGTAHQSFRIANTPGIGNVDKLILINLDSVAKAAANWSAASNVQFIN